MAISTSQINLSWTVSTDNVGVVGYQVFRNGANVGTSTFSLKSDSASNLGIYTAASGGGTEALTITSSGNVGIGTTSPSTTFGLVGSEYMTGGLGVGKLNTTAGTIQTTGAITSGAEVVPVV